MIADYSLSAAAKLALEADVVTLTQELIQIDSSNWGESPETIGEAEVADYCAQRLREVGYDPEVYITTSDARRGVHLRIPGSDPDADALVVHGHIDVVPAIAADWTHAPFCGEIHDGFIWGRGAVDMKDMDAMILAVLRHWAREGIRPRRDLIIVFFPDEEAGMHHGSAWVVANRPEFFEGATQAIGEVGGFSISVRDDLRLYPIQTAENEAEPLGEKSAVLRREGLYQTLLAEWAKARDLDHRTRPRSRASRELALSRAVPGATPPLIHELTGLNRLFRLNRATCFSRLRPAVAPRGVATSACCRPCQRRRKAPRPIR